MAGFSLIGCVISVIGYREDQRIGGLLEKPENGPRVQALKKLIDKGELYDILEEIEERNKDQPNKKELCRKELTSRLKVVADKMSSSKVN